MSERFDDLDPDVKPDQLQLFYDAWQEAIQEKERIIQEAKNAEDKAWAKYEAVASKLRCQKCLNATGNIPVGPTTYCPRDDCSGHTELGPCPACAGTGWSDKKKRKTR